MIERLLIFCLTTFSTSFFSLKNRRIFVLPPSSLWSEQNHQSHLHANYKILVIHLFLLRPLLELLVRLLFYFLAILLPTLFRLFLKKERKKISTFLSAHTNWSYHPFPQSSVKKILAWFRYKFMIHVYVIDPNRRGLICVCILN